MARPTKRGLDYFPLDVDFLSDDKIKILDARYGSDGIVVYISILCRIYNNGYFLKIEDEEDFFFLLAKERNLSLEAVKQIVQYLASRSLLDANLLSRSLVLTSAGIQRRYLAAVKQIRKKNVESIKGDYWLLDDSEVEEIESFYSRDQNRDLSGKNDSKSGKNDSKSGKNDIKENEIEREKENEREKREKMDLFSQRFAVVFPDSFDPTGMDFDVLSEKFDESEFLRAVAKDSFIEAHYNDIISDKYKTYKPFKRTEQNPATELPAQKRVTDEKEMSELVERVQERYKIEEGT